MNIVNKLKGMLANRGGHLVTFAAGFAAGAVVGVLPGKVNELARGFLRDTLKVEGVA